MGLLLGKGREAESSRARCGVEPGSIAAKKAFRSRRGAVSRREGADSQARRSARARSREEQCCKRGAATPPSSLGAGDYHHPDLDRACCDHDSHSAQMDATPVDGCCRDRRRAGRAGVLWCVAARRACDCRPGTVGEDIATSGRSLLSKLSDTSRMKNSTLLLRQYRSRLPAFKQAIFSIYVEIRFCTGSR